MRPFYRYLIPVVVMFCLSTEAAELTEYQAVARGMAQENLRTLLSAQQTQAEGRAAAAGRWANPEIEYSQESLDLPAGQSEERTWWLRQRLNLAGGKGLEREAAAKERLAAMSRVALQQRTWRAEIRQRFYVALAEQDRMRVLSRHQQRLEQISTIIKQRIHQGEASRYDGLRIEQEHTLVASGFLQAQAQMAAAREQLFSLVGGQPQPVTGALIPPAPDASPIDSTLVDHPHLQALAAERDSARLSAQASRRKAWPELTVGVGRKELDEPGVVADGNVFALGIELPLFDRGTGETQIAESIARQRQADYALTAAQLASDIRAARLNLQAQREAALSFQASIDAGDASLTAIAEKAYQAGEIGIMELIDAYRTELTTYQHFIERALAARMTYIQLQRLRGEL